VETKGLEPSTFALRKGRALGPRSGHARTGGDKGRQNRGFWGCVGGRRPLCRLTSGAVLAISGSKLALGGSAGRPKATVLPSTNVISPLPRGSACRLDRTPRGGSAHQPSGTTESRRAGRLTLETPGCLAGSEQVSRRGHPAHPLRLRARRMRERRAGRTPD